MATELVALLSPGDLFREQAIGYNPSAYSVLAGSLRGIRLSKTDLNGYTTVFGISASLTMATGLTFSFLITDNNEFTSDLGLAVRLGVTVKRLISGESCDMGTAAGAEQFVAVTLQATTGLLTLATLAIAAANLDSAVVGDHVAVRIRRNASNAADTCQGSVVLVGASVKNT